MLILLSPAKTFNDDLAPPEGNPEAPAFIDQAETLVKALRGHDREGLQGLLGISEKLAELNYERFQQWKRPFTAQNARPALRFYGGDVFQAMAADTFSDDDMAFAQEHLRIISGLYGLVRPRDLIQPYRLEMNARLAAGGTTNLYEFWTRQITAAVNDLLPKDGHRPLINLASRQYFKAIQAQKLTADIITPVFKDFKNGQFKVISLYAKKARGAMAAYIIRNRLEDSQAIKAFAWNGYQHSPELDTATGWVFTRHTDAS